MMDSDAEDDDDKRNRKDDDEVESTDKNGANLSPLDARKQGELADGVRKIKVRHSLRSLYEQYLQSQQLKRAHSNDPVSDSRKSPHLTTADSPPTGAPQSGISAAANAGSPPDIASTEPAASLSNFASPFKKHRASIEGLDSNVLPTLEQKSEPPTSHPTPFSHASNAPSTSNAPVQSTAATNVPLPDEDEEL